MCCPGLHVCPEYLALLTEILKLIYPVKGLKSSISAFSQISTFPKKIIIIKKIIVFHAGRRGNSKIFYKARLRPRSDPLPFYIPFSLSTEKVPLIHILSIVKWYPFNILI